MASTDFRRVESSYFNKLTIDGVQKGVEYFQRAVEQDSNYALAYAGLGDCHNGYGIALFHGGNLCCIGRRRFRLRMAPQSQGEA